MNRQELISTLDNIARHWAAHFARLGIGFIDEVGRYEHSGHNSGLTYKDKSGLNVRVWAWSYTDNDGTRGVAVRILDEDDDTAPVGEAWAYIQ